LILGNFKMQGSLEPAGGIQHGRGKDAPGNLKRAEKKALKYHKFCGYRRKKRNLAKKKIPTKAPTEHVGVQWPHQEAAGTVTRPEFTARPRPETPRSRVGIRLGTSLTRMRWGGGPCRKKGTLGPSLQRERGGGRKSTLKTAPCPSGLTTGLRPSRCATATRRPKTRC